MDTEYWAAVHRLIVATGYTGMQATNMDFTSLGSLNMGGSNYLSH